jgi:hypothetical protein
MIKCRIEHVVDQQQAVDRLAIEIASEFEDFCGIKVLCLNPTINCAIEFKSSASVYRLLRQSDLLAFSWATITFEKVHLDDTPLLPAGPSNLVSKPLEKHSSPKNDHILNHENSFDDNGSRTRFGQDGVQHEPKNSCFHRQATVTTSEPTVTTSIDTPNGSEPLGAFLAQDKNPVDPVDNSKSRFILISNLESPQLRAKTLANLIGCYGNVKSIAFSQQRGMAVVELDCVRGVSRVYQYLNKFPAFGPGLQIQKLLKHFNMTNFLMASAEEFTAISPPPKLYRFKSNLEIRLNSPANLLHFTNVDINVDVAFLYIIISLIHEPRSIYVLTKRVHGARMYLVEFTEAFQAAEVLAVMHNKQVGEKLLKVSF